MDQDDPEVIVLGAPQRNTRMDRWLDSEDEDLPIAQPATGYQQSDKRFQGGSGVDDWEQMYNVDLFESATLDDFTGERKKNAAPAVAGGGGGGGDAGDRKTGPHENEDEQVALHSYTLGSPGQRGDFPRAKSSERKERKKDSRKKDRRNGSSKKKRGGKRDPPSRDVEIPEVNWDRIIDLASSGGDLFGELEDGVLRPEEEEEEE